MINTKKAAMFGLDARIALAIFGALSVISGAALYSAIKEAKVIAFITELDNITKAIDSYRVDVGEDIHEATSNTTSISRMGYLVNNTANKIGWSGPYVNYESASANRFYWDDFYVTSHLTAKRDGLSGLNNGNVCNLNNQCFLYIEVVYSGSDKASAIRLFESIDQKSRWWRWF